MAIRKLRVTRSTDIAVASEVTLEIVGSGPDPLLASDCVDEMLPTIVVAFAVGDSEKMVPIPVVPGFTAIGKGCTARLVEPAPAATLPAAVASTVGYEGASARTAFYTDPVFADPMYPEGE